MVKIAIGSTGACSVQLIRQKAFKGWSNINHRTKNWASSNTAEGISERKTYFHI